MRIAINALSIRAGQTGGGETYLVNLTRAMAAAGPESDFVIIVSRTSRALFENMARNVRVVAPKGFLAGRWARVAYERCLLARAVARLDADVVLMPGNAGMPSPPCPEVVVVQSLLYLLAPEEVNPWRRWYFSRVMPRDLSRATLALAVSQDIGGILTDQLGVPPARIRVVHEGVDIAFAPVADQARIDDAVRAAGGRRPYILFVSALKPYKNADKAVRALAHLNRGLSSPRDLLVVGSDRGGIQADLAELAIKEGVADRVHFTGPVPHNKLDALYSGADALVFPSRIESFGLPVLEAMACGTPVVASNRSAVPEIAGDAALAVDPDDVSALANALRQVIEDPALRETLVAKGLDRARHFTWERAARGTLDVLAEAAATTPDTVES